MFKPPEDRPWGETPRRDPVQYVEDPTDPFEALWEFLKNLGLGIILSLLLCVVLLRDLKKR